MGLFLDDEMKILLCAFNFVANALELELATSLHSRFDGNLKILVFLLDAALAVEGFALYAEFLFRAVEKPI